MTLVMPTGVIAILLFAAADAPVEVPVMTEEAPVLSLDVREDAGTVEVRLIGLSPRATAVSYTLEVTGQSTSRHRGKTTLTADTRAVLSTMSTRAGDSWCVKLLAEEDGRPPYEILRGSCITA